MARVLVATCFFFLGAFAVQVTVLAHDVPGQPSHVPGEDPDGPPSVQLHARSGQYHVVFTATPAIPKPGERGQLGLQAERVDNGQPFTGRVTFTAREDGFFSATEEVIGTQYLNDDIYRQGFLFKEPGDYVIRAEFEADGEKHGVELPLTIGTRSRLGTIGAVLALLLTGIVGVNLLQRRRLQHLQTGTAAP